MPIAARTAPLVLLACVSCKPVSAVERAPAPASARRQPAQPTTPPSPLKLPALDIVPAAHPLESLARGELIRRVRHDPGSLGSVSIGRANRGALFNAVQMPEGPHWELVDPDRSWATRETVDALIAAIDTVHERYPGSPPLFIGDMSRRRGGYFRPHRSHQSGRDADIGYYYSDGSTWYQRANADNLDRERTWTLVKGLLTQGSVEYLFVDRSVQQLLKEHALSVEHHTEWVEELFNHPGGRAPGVVRHVRGHQTHMHVRFFNDTARETAKRTYALLARYGRL